MGKINIKQHDITDCGAACLASVSAYYHLQLPLARLRQATHTNKKGTNLLGLVEAAQKIGFEAKGVKGDFKSLYKIPKPAIAHITMKDQLQHYVVIYGIGKKTVKLMDPGTGTMIHKEHSEFKKEWTGILLLLLPSEKFTPRNEKISALTRCWFLLMPHKMVLLQALIGALIYTLLGLSTSIYIQKITDHVLVGANTKLLNLLSVIMLILLVLQVLVGVFKDIFMIKTGQQIDARLILGYYKHLLSLPQQFFDTMRVGEIISRINDAVKIRIFINSTSLTLTANFFTVIFAFALMFSYYWKLALIMCMIIPVYMIIYLITNRLNKKTERKIMERSADIESQLVESLNAVGTIKRFGLESFANIKTETRFINLLKTGFTSSLNSVFSQTSSLAISKFFTVLLLWCGAYYVIGKEITPGELLSFYAIIGYFTGPVGSLISANKTVQNALIAADRLFEIMDLEREENENKFQLTPESINDISFNNISFTYGAKTAVFSNLNLTIKKGNITALVGESGSGKTTLISLLQNIYPIQNGRISIGNMNLKYINNKSLREIIGVVPQKIDLFAGNVIENIAVGQFQPDMKRVISICKEIRILNFIENLPNGFNTYLGENGATLSGGQKQAIAIARALYKNPEILVLDEATSSLDSLAENHIQTIIKGLRDQHKTIIIIAHRLSTVVHADTIVVMHQGQIKEMGSHIALFEKKQHYYQLWSQQIPNIISKHNLKNAKQPIKQAVF